MVVINTKKIFITILLLALLLVGSALTVFAFDFSAPQTENSDYYQLYYIYNYQYDDSTGQYNNRPVLLILQSVPLNSNIGGDFTVYVTDYGLELFSVNGFTIDSMYNLIDSYLRSHPSTVLLGIYSDNSSPSTWIDDISGAYIYASNSNYIWHIRQDLNNQFFNYESQYNNVLRSYDLLMQSYTTLNSNYQTLQTNYTNLQADYNYINNEFDLLTNSYNELDSQYRELATQYSYYKNAYENSLIDIDSLESTISNMEIVISQLETIVSQLELELETSYMSGYTSAIEEINAFESGIYTIFSSPFVLVGELSQIEIFGSSITKIVGIILLFVILSVVLAFLWKVIPFV